MKAKRRVYRSRGRLEVRTIAVRTRQSTKLTTTIVELPLKPQHPNPSVLDELLLSTGD